MRIQSAMTTESVWVAGAEKNLEAVAIVDLLGDGYGTS